MDSAKFKEFVDKIKFSKEISDMENDQLCLKKYLNVLIIMKDRFNRGDIAKGVNKSLEVYYKKYNTSFVCDRDGDFIIKLRNLI